MKKKELARRLARALQLTHADAADCVDRLVRDIRQRTRKGRTAKVPGLGTFLPGAEVSFDDASVRKDTTSR